MKVYRIELWHNRDDVFKTIICVAEDFDAAVSEAYTGMAVELNYDDINPLHIGKMEQLSADLILVGNTFYEYGVAHRQK